MDKFKPGDICFLNWEGCNKTLFRQKVIVGEKFILGGFTNYFINMISGDKFPEDIVGTRKNDGYEIACFEDYLELVKKPVITYPIVEWCNQNYK